MIRVLDEMTSINVRLAQIMIAELGTQLRQALIQAAQTAARSKSTYWERIVIASQKAHERKESYSDLGPLHLGDHLSGAQQAAILPGSGTDHVEEQLSYEVTLQPAQVD